MIGLVHPQIVLNVTSPGHVLLVHDYVVIDAAALPDGKEDPEVMIGLLRRHGQKGMAAPGAWLGHPSICAGRGVDEAARDYETPEAVYVRPGEWELTSTGPLQHQEAPKVVLTAANGNTGSGGYLLEFEIPDAAVEWVGTDDQGRDLYRWTDSDALRWMQWAGFYPYSELEWG
ncbi:hypothetical protein LG293_17915 (plasmid) [Citricoccus nitrophenolicus]